MGPRRLLYGMARQRLAAVGLTTQASCGWNCSNGPAIPAIPRNALPERSDVLAFLIGRKEREIVVHPDELRRFRLRERLDRSFRRCRECLSKCFLQCSDALPPRSLYFMGSSIGAGWLTTGSSSPQRRRGADRDVIEAFAALHDSCRLNDEDDAGHGERGRNPRPGASGGRRSRSQRQTDAEARQRVQGTHRRDDVERPNDRGVLRRRSTRPFARWNPSGATLPR